MTKADLATAIQTSAGMTMKDAAETLETLLEIVKDTLAGGEEIKVANFGKFSIQEKGERRGRNPQTGEEITIEGRRVLTFKPSATLKDAINA
jgi:integration host factor subunit alpha